MLYVFPLTHRIYTLQSMLNHRIASTGKVLHCCLAPPPPPSFSLSLFYVPLSRESWPLFASFTSSGGPSYVGILLFFKAQRPFFLFLSFFICLPLFPFFFFFFFFFFCCCCIQNFVPWGSFLV